MCVSDLPLFERLKQRKIVQRGLAYLAGAFVVFQAVEVLAEPWGLSPGTVNLMRPELRWGSG